MLLRLAVAFAAVAVLISLTGAVEAENQIALVVNGQQLETDVAPILVNNRTLVPVRVVSEHLGAAVDWVQEEQKVVISGWADIFLWVGQTTATVNGQNVSMDVAPRIVEGRTMVPLRFVSEALGCTVRWDSKTRTVFIDDNRNYISEVNLVERDGHTWLQIGGRGDLQPKRFELDNPKRLVLDFENTVLSTPINLDVHRFGVEVVRASQFSREPLVARVVLELSEGSALPQFEQVAENKVVLWLNGRLTGVVQQVSPGREALLVKVDKLENFEVAASWRQAQSQVIYGYVNTQSLDLNLRGGPGTEYPVVGTAPKGTVFEVIGQTDGWYQLNTEYNQDVWVSDEYFAIDLTMLRNEVRVRAEPVLTDGNENVVDYLMRGEEFTVLQRLPGWVKVRTPRGKTGYVVDWLVGLNERLVDNKNPSDDAAVADIITLTLHNVASQSQFAELLPGVVTSVKWQPHGDNTEVTIELSEPVGYAVSRVDEGLLVDFGACLENIEITDSKLSGTRIVLSFDKPTRYTINQLVGENALLLELPHSYTGLESLSSVDDELLESVGLTNGPDGLQVKLNLRKFSGYKVSSIGYSDVFEITLFSASLEGKTIAIDPGHGGGSTGAIGPSGIKEKDVNLKIAMKLRSLLEQNGATVIMTRDGDYNYPYEKRPELVNSSGADLLISIHCNGFSNPESHGIETLYYPRAENQRLAALVQRRLVANLGLANRGIVPRPRIVITRDVNMPSVLAEVAFLTNPREEQLLASVDFQEKAALSLFQAIQDYFQGK